MSDDIKELVKRLRAPEMFLNRDRQEAADALEALVAERDRLKAAMAVIADMLSRRLDGNRRWDLKSIYDIAREALEAKE